MEFNQEVYNEIRNAMQRAMYDEKIIQWPESLCKLEYEGVWDEYHLKDAVELKRPKSKAGLAAKAFCGNVALTAAFCGANYRDMANGNGLVDDDGQILYKDMDELHYTKAEQNLLIKVVARGANIVANSDDENKYDDDVIAAPAAASFETGFTMHQKLKA